MRGHDEITLEGIFDVDEGAAVAFLITIGKSAHPSRHEWIRPAYPQNAHSQPLLICALLSPVTFDLKVMSVVSTAKGPALISLNT
jgi:hypothetical protein